MVNGIVGFLIFLQIERDHDEISVRIFQRNLTGSRRLRKLFLIMKPVSKRKPEGLDGHCISLFHSVAFRQALGKIREGDPEAAFLGSVKDCRVERLFHENASRIEIKQ